MELFTPEIELLKANLTMLGMSEAEQEECLTNLNKAAIMDYLKKLLDLLPEEEKASFPKDDPIAATEIFRKYEINAKEIFAQSYLSVMKDFTAKLEKKIV